MGGLAKGLPDLRMRKPLLATNLGIGAGNPAGFRFGARSS